MILCCILLLEILWLFNFRWCLLFPHQLHLVNLEKVDVYSRDIFLMKITKHWFYCKSVFKNVKNINQVKSSNMIFDSIIFVIYFANSSKFCKFVHPNSERYTLKWSLETSLMLKIEELHELFTGNLGKWCGRRQLLFVYFFTLLTQKSSE